jgi:hypothetical protein
LLLGLAEIVSLLVRFDHVARCIENPNHTIMRAAIEFRVVNRIARCVRPAISKPTEWQRIANQIDAATIFTGSGEIVG